MVITEGVRYVGLCVDCWPAACDLHLNGALEKVRVVCVPYAKSLHVTCMLHVCGS